MNRMLGNNKPFLRKIKFVGMLLVSITKLKAKFIHHLCQHALVPTSCLFAFAVATGGTRIRAPAHRFLQNFLRR